ncbi:MAG: hypothetical protein LBS52_07490 [Dysgonamonadaceae bacterium]|jgi:hypothetical protein|nr:hypothetical protein [Dysgonamonadaceae bacterium]
MKTLYFVPEGGLANRIRAISSALAFCRDKDIALKIFWFKDWGMGARFHELFDAIQCDTAEVIDTDWRHNYLDLQRTRNYAMFPYLVYRFNNQIFKNIRNLNANPNIAKSTGDFYISSCYEFYGDTSDYSLLKPIESIQKGICAERQKFGNQAVIGVHIRRTDFPRSINESPTELFIEKMKREIENDPNVKFFLASDDEREKQSVSAVFREKMISFASELKRDTAKGVREALIELYLLSATKKIIGVRGSSFSEVAAKAGGIPLETITK